MLDERKKKIINKIVDIYTRTGEPVGSKLICDELDLALSSATIRKEMSELIQQGYLEQPHTSAGRIPSEQGYRIYIDSLMKQKNLSDGEKEMIKALFPKACEPDELLEKAGLALAKLTNYTVFTSIPSSAKAKVKKVEVLSMGKRAAMLVVVTSTGILKTRFVYGFSGLTPALCETFSNMANLFLKGHPLTELTPADLQNLVIQLPDQMLTTAPLLSELSILIKEAGESLIKLEGEANLFNHKELNTETAKRILNLLTRQEALSEIIKARNEVFSVLIGEETNYCQLKGASVVLTNYRISEESKGQIGIVGPLRMDYPKIIPRIDYFGKVLSEVFGQMLDE